MTQEPLTLFPDAPRLCEWCQARPCPRGSARFCGKKSRQTAFRLRLRAEVAERAAVPGRFAYADPPYPGRASLYADQPTYAGEVDHRALVERLERGGYMGWALSTAADALEDVLPIVRASVGPRTYVKVCAWVKPIAPAPATFGLHNTWEPLVVVRGRQERPGKRDFLIAQPARFGGELVGRKPIAFAAWLFACLGMRPGDALHDLFPGTGVIGNAWRELGSARADGREFRDPQEEREEAARPRDTPDLLDLGVGRECVDEDPDDGDEEAHVDHQGDTLHVPGWPQGREAQGGAR